MGKGRDKPYPLPQLGLNAQPLRFLNFLVDHTIVIKYGDMSLKLPHPAAYALHKLIVFERRKTKDKAEKDSVQAVQLLKYLAEKPAERGEIGPIFATMHPRWQKTVFANLEKLGEKELAELL